jgi:hypothetical protein
MAMAQNHVKRACPERPVGKLFWAAIKSWIVGKPETGFESTDDSGCEQRFSICADDRSWSTAPLPS